MEIIEKKVAKLEYVSSIKKKINEIFFNERSINFSKRELISFFSILFFLLILKDKYLYLTLPSLIILIFNGDNKKFQFYVEKLGEFGAYSFAMSLLLNRDYLSRGFFLMLISIIINRLIFKKKIEFVKNRVFYFYIFILMAGSIWNFFSPGGVDSSLSFFDLNKKFILIFLLFNIIDNIEKLKILLFFISMGLFCSSAYTILEFYQKGISNPLYRVGGFLGIGRLSAFLAMNVTFLFSYIYPIKKSKQIALNGLYTLSLISVILTKSRMLFLIVLIFHVIVILFYFNIRKIIICSIMLLILIVASKETSVFKEYKKRIYSISNIDENHSNLLRIYMWKAAVKRYEENPIFGVGSKNSKQYIVKYSENLIKEKNDMEVEELKKIKYISKELKNKYEESHNIYLNFLSELGIFSLLYIIQFFWIIPRNFFEVYKNLSKKDDKVLLICALMTIFCYYLYGVSWSIWMVYPELQYALHICIFILVFYEKDLKKKEV